MGLEFNFKNVKSKLRQLEKKASKEVLDKALKAGADVTKDVIKDYVYTNVRDTGELHKSIDTSKPRGSLENRTIDIGIMSKNRKVIERGYYQHYGTRKKLGNRWMEISFDLSKEEARKAIKKSLKEDLKL